MNLRWAASAVSATVLVIACVLIAGVAVIAKPVRGNSMTPTLEPGDRVVVDSLDGATPERFDLVVTRFDPAGPEVIKRVIGLPGDRVSVRKAGTEPGVVRVQPEGTGPWLVVDNPAWAGQWALFGEACCNDQGKKSSAPTEQTVPVGTVFLLGDHPAQSDDSRTHGWSRLELMQGRVTWRVYPIGALGRIGTGAALIPAP